MPFRREIPKPQPTRYVADNHTSYGRGFVYAFQVGPFDGDITVYFYDGDLPSTAYIHYDDWESFARTVNEEHHARETRSNDEHRNTIYGRGNNADNDE